MTREARLMPGSCQNWQYCRLLKEELLPFATTAAAAFLTTKGDIIQYLSPCLQEDRNLSCSIWTS